MSDEQQAMSSERLQEIRNDLLNQETTRFGRHAFELLAEVERMRAREAALVTVVRRVAASADGRMLMCMCGIVGPTMRYDAPTVMFIDKPVIHAPDCLFEQARALLASADEQKGGGDGQR